MDRSQHSVRIVLLSTVSASALILGAHVALSNPVGGQVEAGSATIKTTAPENLQVTQSTDKAIINWKSFDIGAGETTQFTVPTQASVTLNRDVSGNPSKIFGSLKSNGQLYLVNRDGILFGKTARVNVAGLVATTHDIKNSDFMAGRLKFDTPGNPKASVINEGKISIADYGIGAFVAPYVRNDGAIAARLGKVALASAKGFTLDLYGDQLISFLIPNPNNVQMYGPDGKPVKALVENHGSIIANGGEIYMTAAAARGVVNSVINTDGIVQADTVQQTGGKIILGGGSAGTVKVSGKLLARGEQGGQKGGTIIATGETLVADQNALLDVSGAAGGGKLMFGGDYHGGDANAVKNAPAGFALEPEKIANAQNTTVEAGALFNANATSDGNGGKVVVWADRNTDYAGAITAEGAGTGSGGDVEVSGKQTLSFNGTVNLSAPSGNNGTLLLDPENVTIDSATTSNMANNLTSGYDFTGPTADNGVISASAVDNALQTGDVAISTMLTGSLGTQSGDITVNAPLSWSANSKLDLLSYNNININAPITVGGTTFNAGVSLRYGQATSNGTGATEYVNAKINLPATASFTTQHGSAGPLLSYNIIDTASALQNINSTGLSLNYALGSDIDLSSIANFTPIGGGGASFTGIFDGLGHAIDGLNISSAGQNAKNYAADQGVGFIAVNSGKVENISLGNAAITASGNNRVNPVVGGLVGINSGVVYNSTSSGKVVGRNTNYFAGNVIIGGLVGRNTGIVLSSSASSSVTGLDGNFTDYYIGGLVGYNSIGGKISKSHVSGSVSGAGADLSSYAVGGLVGLNYGAIDESYESGAVNGSDVGSVGDYWDSDVSVGGFAGKNFGAITHSYALGAVNGVAINQNYYRVNLEAGGFVGANESGAAISSSYANGDIYGKGSSESGAANVSVGGMAGANYKNATIGNSYATGSIAGVGNHIISVGTNYIINVNSGGLVGLNSGTLATSYSLGLPSGNGSAYANIKTGGLVGNNTGQVDYAYWDTNSTGQSLNNGSGTGLTATQMLQQSSFAGFDFSKSWSIKEGVSPPTLQVFTTVAPTPTSPPPGGSTPSTPPGGSTNPPSGANSSTGGGGSGGSGASGGNGAGTSVSVSSALGSTGSFTFAVHQTEQKALPANPVYISGTYDSAPKLDSFATPPVYLNSSQVQSVNQFSDQLFNALQAGGHNIGVGTLNFSASHPLLTSLAGTGFDQFAPGTGVGTDMISSVYSFNKLYAAGDYLGLAQWVADHAVIYSLGGIGATIGRFGGMKGAAIGWDIGTAVGAGAVDAAHLTGNAIGRSAIGSGVAYMLWGN